MKVNYKGLRIRIIDTGSLQILLAYDQEGNSVELPEELRRENAARDLIEISAIYEEDEAVNEIDRQL